MQKQVEQCFYHKLLDNHVDAFAWPWLDLKGA